MSPVAFDPVHNYVSTLFNVTSVVSTSGYASEDYSAWGPLAIVLFFFLLFVGGCSGSTAGGMKIFRLQPILITRREHIIRLLHARAVFTRNYNGRAASHEIISSMIDYTYIVLLSLLVITALL